MEAQEIQCVATRLGYYENLINEDEEFTLKDHRLFSENWMKPKRNDAKSKKLIAEAEEYQLATKGRVKDARVAELEVELAELRAKQE